MIYLIYPEKRFVQASTIEGWYADAVDNGEVENTQATSLAEKIAALEDAGIITVGRMRNA